MENQTNVYRNYSSTQQKIQMVSQLRITNREEAMAFLRAVSNINLQIADVLQRESINALALKNRQRVATEAPAVQQEETVKATAVAATPVTEVPNFEEEETHTEADAKARVATLKKAKKNG